MIRSRLLAATALTPIGLLPATGVLAQSSFDWSGFYAGMFGGSHYSETQITDDAVPPNQQGPNLLMLLPDAQQVGIVPLGGANIGYNWQTGMFVFGLEADGSVTHVEGTISGTEGVETDFALDNLLTLRARAGLAVDRTLFFATAGIAMGQSTLNTSYSDPSKNEASGTAKQLMAGLIGGIGVEHAVTDKFSVKLEAKVYDLGTASVQATGDIDYTATAHHAGVIVTTGINVHF
jgi:outer membrane immunogenic protein